MFFSEIKLKWIIYIVILLSIKSYSKSIYNHLSISLGTKFTGPRSTSFTAPPPSDGLALSGTDYLLHHKVMQYSTTLLFLFKRMRNAIAQTCRSDEPLWQHSLGKKSSDQMYAESGKKYNTTLDNFIEISNNSNT